MILLILFLIELIALLLLYRKCSKLYPQLLQLDEKEFKLKKLLPVGLYIVQDVIKYRFDKPRDAVIQGKLAQLYGTKQSASYLHLNMAGNVCIVLLGILITTFLAGASMLNTSLQSDAAAGIVLKENKIERPALGEGSKEATVKATYEAGEEHSEMTYDIVIGEQIPGDEKCVELVLDALDDAILGTNQSLDQVTDNLTLFTKSNQFQAEIQWESGNEARIGKDGAVKRPARGEGDDKVTLTAFATKGSANSKRNYDVTVLERTPLSSTEKIAAAEKKVEGDLEAVNQIKTEKTVNLPAKISGAVITWKNVEEKSSNTISIVVFGILVVFLIVFLSGRRLDENIKLRTEQIKVDYPEFLNKLIVLLTSGMNIQKALEKIAADYGVNAAKAGSRRPLYEELSAAVSEMSGGKVFSEAMNSFALRCKTREILKFVSIIELNFKKGSGELIMTLKVQGAEAWESRKAVAKRRGEEASTKLLLPMAIMLIAILLIVVTPAALSLTGM